MRSRLTVRQYNNTLSNTFKSIGSHLFTNIFFLGTLFFFTNAMRLHYCISDGDSQVFHGDMIIVVRVFFLYFTTVKRNIVFSR